MEPTPELDLTPVTNARTELRNTLLIAAGVRDEEHRWQQKEGIDDNDDANERLRAWRREHGAYQLGEQIMAEADVLIAAVMEHFRTRLLHQGLPPEVVDTIICKMLRAKDCCDEHREELIDRCLAYPWNVTLVAVG